MEQQALIEELKRIILPVLEEQGIELVELIFSRTGPGWLLRLLVDKEAGINLQECAALNKRIGFLLDNQDIIKNRYVLEVSSPGLDRPLETKKDFLRCMDKTVRFFLNELIEAKLEWAGRIQQADDEAVTIVSQDKIIRIPFLKINKAKQIISNN